MADVVNGNEPEEELVDYEEEEAAEPDQAAKGEEGVKRGHVALHTAGFKEFLLKPEILRAITNNAFEHPSEGVCSDLMELRCFRSAELCCPSLHCRDTLVGCITCSSTSMYT